MIKAEEKALIDSRATENFIDHKTVEWLKLRTKLLIPARPVFNVDGTHNKARMINKTFYLYVILGDMEQWLQFFITDLSKDRMILGYPWLKTFNSQINWAEASIKGRLKVQTTVSKAHEAKHVALRLR
jgi:hypothetical protein